jgi:hypothetical protein
MLSIKIPYRKCYKDKNKLIDNIEKYRNDLFKRIADKKIIFKLKAQTGKNKK